MSAETPQQADARTDSIQPFGYLRCKNENCKRPILLPEPRHLGTPPNPKSWPRGVPLRNFLCPECKHVYEYSALDCHLGAVDVPDQSQVRKGRSVVRAEVKCGGEYCLALTQIYIPVAFATVHVAEEVRALLRESVLKAVRCSLCGQVLNPSYVDLASDESLGVGGEVQFDDEWLNVVPQVKLP